MTSSRIGVRFSPEGTARLDEAARILGVDRSHIVREGSLSHAARIIREASQASPPNPHPICT